MEISNEQISFKQSQLKIVDIYSWLEGQILQYKIKIQRNSAWRNYKWISYTTYIYFKWYT